MLSLLCTLAQFALSALFLSQSVLSHCKIVHVAANLNNSGLRSHGFGVDINNKYPWFMRQGGDAGPDAPFFTPNIQYVDNPVYPCGENEVWGALDIASWLSQAEGMDVATTSADGKFEAMIFQVNRDGGGECTCEYDTSATARSWQKCKTLVNPPGIEGMWPADRVNHTASFQLPMNTICRGGVFQNTCIVRIRCGWKLRFGGCVAIKTPASPPKLQLKVVGGRSTLMQVKTDLASGDVNTIAQKVLDTMQAKGALVPNASRSTKRSSPPQSKNMPHFRPAIRAPPSSMTSKTDAISMKVVELMRARRLVLVEKKAASVLKEFAQSQSYV